MRFPLVAVRALTAFLAAVHPTAWGTPFEILDGEGFEPPAYAGGSLEGQLASTDGGSNSSPWQQSPLAGSSTALVQSSVVRSGTQAVRVDRAANSDDRWAVPVAGYPGRQFVVVEWDMRVDPSTGPANFGPFLGVEAYDSGDLGILRSGSFGVDAKTGDLLYTDRASGLVEASGIDVPFGSWNRFQIQLDFINGTYSGLFNGTHAFTTDFETAGVAGFSDADIAAIAAGGDPDSQAATGTAYLDNLRVFESDHSLLAGQDRWGNTPFASTGPAGSPFVFTDISSTGRELNLSLGGADDGSATVDLPVPFPFYGRVHSRLRVSTNGYISTDPADAGSDFTPDTALPVAPSSGGGDRIYVLHDDLELPDSGALHYEYIAGGIPGHPLATCGGVSVIQWTGVQHRLSPVSFSFQALLFDDGSIYLAYPAGNPETGSGSTTGIQIVGATAGSLFVNRGPGSIPDDFAISVIPAPMVTSPADSGPGSLRDLQAFGGNPRVFTFDPRVFDSEANRVITLASPLPVNFRASTIDASGVGGMTIDAAGTGRILENAAGGSLRLRALNLTGGSASEGGAIRNDGVLDIRRCCIHDNAGNGAVYATGADAVTSISDSTIAFNSGTFGTAFLSRGKTATFSHVTIANNSASGGTAGIVHESGTLTLDGCLISNPDAPVDPDLGGAGAVVVASSPNFVRAHNPGGPYGAALTPGPTVGTLASPVEPLLYGDNVVGLVGEPLVNFGGPTLALLPQPGSPVIDAAGHATGTDQRGLPAVGARDLGSVETTWNANVSPGAPGAPDLIVPSDPVALFPASLTLRSGATTDFFDNLSNTVTFESELNAGLTVSPFITSSALSGLSVDSSGVSAPSFPASFLILGSNDFRSFEPLVSGTLPPVSGAGEVVGVSFPVPLATHAHYRLVIPSSTNPDTNLISVADVRLHAPTPDRPPVITEFSLTPEDPANGIHRVDLTFDSIPGERYYLAIDSLEAIAGGSPLDIVLDANPDAWSTSHSRSVNLNDDPSLFFRATPLDIP